MKYGFIFVAVVLTLPACCLRKQKKMVEAPMIIEEESLLHDTDTSSPDDMAILQDEMSSEAGK